jgi:hypothetical protein
MHYESESIPERRPFFAEWGPVAWPVAQVVCCKNCNQRLPYISTVCVVKRAHVQALLPTSACYCGVLRVHQHGCLFSVHVLHLVHVDVEQHPSTAQVCLMYSTVCQAMYWSVIIPLLTVFHSQSYLCQGPISCCFSQLQQLVQLAFFVAASVP